MKLSLQTLNFESSKYPDLADTLRRIREMGVEFVDLAAFENWQGIYPSKLLEDDYFQEMVSIIKKSGLSVYSINVGLSHEVTTENPEEFARITTHFNKLCEFAKVIGTTNITVGAGKIMDRSEVEKNVSRLIERLPAWAKTANQNGLTLSLECHQASTLEKIPEIMQVMDALYPLVGLTIDCSHLEMQCIPIQDTAPIMKYVYNSHIRYASKDNMQQTFEKNTLDIKMCVDMLKDINYDGCLAIEYFNDFDEGRQLPIMLDQLRVFGL